MIAGGWEASEKAADLTELRGVRREEDGMRGGGRESRRTSLPPLLGVVIKGFSRSAVPLWNAGGHQRDRPEKDCRLWKPFSSTKDRWNLLEDDADEGGKRIHDPPS